MVLEEFFFFTVMEDTVAACELMKESCHRVRESGREAGRERLELAVPLL